MGDAADSAADPELLRLENLDTDLRPLPAAVEATRHAIADDDANSYLPFPGHERLRRAVAAHVGRGVREIGWRSTLITAGGLNGILNVLLAVLEPGDEVVLTDPVYAGLLNRVRVAGGVPRLARLEPSPAGWSLDLDSPARRSRRSHAGAPDDEPLDADGARPRPGRLGGGGGSLP